MQSRISSFSTTDEPSLFLNCSFDVRLDDSY